MSSLASDYNGYLVMLSVAIAGLASYTTLDLVGRITATQGRIRLIWLLCGAIAMGTGIWSMHFIGMLAFRVPLMVRYDVPTVCLSILPAILASGLALFLVSDPEVGTKRLTASSLLLASGIVTMHYGGMAAIRMEAMIHYHWLTVMSSVLIAIAVSWIGLYLAVALRDETASLPIWKKGLAACIMGAAIPTMHYTGMAAARIVPLAPQSQSSLLRSAENALVLTVAITIGTSILLGLTVLTALFERRLAVQTSYTEALQDSQQYLQTILQGVQVGVMVIEEEHTITVSNQAVLEMLGLSTAADLEHVWKKAAVLNRQGAESSDLSNGPGFQDVARSLQPVLTQMATRQSAYNIIIYIAPDVVPINPDAFSVEASLADSKALLVNVMPLPLAQSSTALSPSQMVCTFSDISELKRAEYSLQKSEVHARTLARKEALFSQIATQIRRSLNVSDTLQTAVCEVRKLFHTERALIYQFDDHWHGEVVWEDVVQPWRSTLGEVADNCFPEECLERYKNGYVRAIDNVAHEHLEAEHREFLQRLQIQANLIVPIMVSDRLWGLLIIHQCSQPRMWTPEEGDLLHRLAIQLGIAIQQADLYAQAEKNAVQAQLHAQQLQQSEEQLRQQVEARQQALQDLQQMQVQMVQSEKMSLLGQLVAGVAHEINNPVNFIHGNLTHVEDYCQELLGLMQLYQQQYPDPQPDIESAMEAMELDFLLEDLPKTLKSMKIGTNRIRQIVLSLRNFSRMDESEFKEVDLHEGIDSTLMILQHRFKETVGSPAINIMRDYAPLPKVACYPGKLNQVFMNILTNALDALESHKDRQSHPGEIIIRTSLLPVSSPNNALGQDPAPMDNKSEDEQNHVQIVIVDNGPGIPEHIQQRIFEPFFTTKPVGKGTGLGMSISYQIITELHQGHIKCVSRPNEGTEFLIQLPLRHPQ